MRGLLLALILLPGVAEGFNIDVGTPRVFQGPAESQFGYRVLQWGSGGDKGLLVGAPWDGEGRGDIYRCHMGAPNSSCAKANLGAAVPWLSSSAGHLGMTLAEAEDGGLVACAPLWSQQCGTSVFSPGRCVQLDQELQLVATMAPTAQRCSTFMDIVVLLDGSNSIYPWEEVQAFLGNVLERFFIGPGQTQVGVLQYGEHVVQEWALGQHPTAQSLLEAARNLTRQEGRETRTAMAIREACTDSFRPERGGRPGAARLLLVLTDGESHDGDELPAALAECERRNVTRYAIAVLGHYLRRQQDPEDFIREIKFIASDPDEKYFFNVTDEAALNDIVDALGDRIFSLEGTHGDNESAFELEMSQIGFSIHHLEQDGILFGMVGAHGWEGGVLEERRRGRVVPAPGAFQEQFPLQLRNHAAYLGYSVSSLQLPGGRRLLVAGAPRFQHKGKVVLFQLDPAGTVTVAQALTGDQIGSYFGSEVLALDLEGDGDSELLLVAAPSYLGGQSWETGRVYVYRVGQERLSPAGSLLPEPRPQDSRFGSALGAVPNLSQDGLAGAVVGAPLEDGHRGALYVFHVAPGTLLPQRKQRIEAAALGWSLRYFGISVDGRTDMDGDGLVDVAVGAQGAAVVLRSRWILQVAAAVSVEPAAVSVTRRNCRRGGSGAVCLRARLCFRAQSRARSAPPGMDVDPVFQGLRRRRRVRHRPGAQGHHGHRGLQAEPPRPEEGPEEDAGGGGAGEPQGECLQRQPVATAAWEPPLLQPRAPGAEFGVPPPAEPHPARGPARPGPPRRPHPVCHRAPGCQCLLQAAPPQRGHPGAPRGAAAQREAGLLPQPLPGAELQPGQAGPGRGRLHRAPAEAARELLQRGEVQEPEDRQQCQPGGPWGALCAGGGGSAQGAAAGAAALAAPPGVAVDPGGQRPGGAPAAGTAEPRPLEAGILLPPEALPGGGGGGG
ncbi:integrin alpha-10 isoform X9 [Zonotrichia albicollis]|uniref:integrin alpha-10 isoform X9 n=1 Tax=Zonotrichia albicollis TaxID=44394 RepID=UPI003D80F3B2